MRFIFIFYVRSSVPGLINAVSVCFAFREVGTLFVSLQPSFLFYFLVINFKFFWDYRLLPSKRVCLLSFNSSSIWTVSSKFDHVPITCLIVLLTRHSFGITWVLSSFNASDHSVLFMNKHIFVFGVPHNIVLLIDSFCTVCYDT
jgi:hypothetical protein